MPEVNIATLKEGTIVISGDRDNIAIVLADSAGNKRLGWLGAYGVSSADWDGIIHDNEETIISDTSLVSDMAASLLKLLLEHK
jgi:hypothetical protein